MWLVLSKSFVINLRNSVQQWILFGIPLLFSVGFLMHYIYEWTDNSTIVGIFAPVNESAWEHLKMTFWPILIWWTIGYIILGKKNKITASQWYNSCIIAELVCSLTVLCFYYTYTGALGIELLLLDIFSLLLGVTVAQGMAFHVYKYARFSLYCLYIAVAVLILLAITFTVFTFAPPLIPLFKDSVTGKYGI